MFITVKTMCLTAVFCFVLVCAGRSTALNAFDFRRTVIMMEKPTNYGENLFFRGGLDYSNRENCTTDQPLDENPCNIAIKHVVYLQQVYEAANTWGDYDDYLDWTGPEPKQGKWQGIAAEGTPAIWTTNDVLSDSYNPMNTYGPHYWLVDMEVDCGNVLGGGYFELKGYFLGNWEDDLPLDKSCKGEAGDHNFKSHNHIVRCGYKNVFHFNSPNCSVEAL